MYLPTRLPETETREQSPFTLDALIAWLRTMPGERTYDFKDCDGGCLLGQYFAAAGIKWSGRNYCRMADVSEGVAALSPHTFGAALSRATAIRGV